MPTAAAKTAPTTAKVQTKTVTTVVSDPVEQVVTPPAAPLPEPQENFWQYIQTLKPDDWKKHHVTLYRYPLGQTKPHKLGRYVKTYKMDSALVSEDQVFDEFGGGQFDALLRGPAPDGTDRVTLIAKHSWEMEGPAKNPWPTAAAGQTPGPSELANTLQVVLQNLKQAERLPNAADPAIKESIALIQQLTQAMPKPQGVGELVGALADLKKLTGGSDGQSSIVETIKLLKELGIVGAERKSLASELKEILELTSMMRGEGAPGGGKRDWVTSLIENAPTIIEKVTPIADRFADAARNNARVAEIRSGRIPAQPPASATAAPALTAPATPAESPAPRVVTAPETEPAAGASTAPPRVVMQPPSLDWVKARAVALFAAGKPGDVVAEWLDSVDDQLGDFLGSMDEEKFAAFIKGDPILSQIATAPRFPQFVAEFVDFFTPDTDTAPANKE